jgi:hypothetical protein
MKLVSKENLKVKKIEKEILNEEIKDVILNENFKDKEVISEMFSIKDIEKKINESIEVIADKVVNKMLDHFIKNDKLMDTMSESILKKINIKVEKV